jgi:hypothetical protein
MICQIRARDVARMRDRLGSGSVGTDLCLASKSFAAWPGEPTLGAPPPLLLSESGGSSTYGSKPHHI